MSGQQSLIKYYRLKSSMHSGVVVDFSEKEEAFKPFLKLNLPLYEAGVSVPKVFTYNREEFFVFMEDLGSTHLCDINSSDFELFYDKAIDAIVKMQNTETEELEPYDEILLKEDIKLENILNKEELQSVEPALSFIVKELLSQPRELFVHRDYQAKNLMFNCNDSIVVTEYYGAKQGAITYDLASLLKDVNIELEPKTVERLALSFKDKKGIDADNETFLKWFDFSVMHRNLTEIHENKMAIKYLIETASKYAQTKSLAELLKRK
jgi:aminoglycoside/choline kinase family phosphotransferase